MEQRQFILLGLPGAGVEAQAIALAEHWQVPHISMEALLHEAIARESAIGVEVRPFVESGERVPDGLMMKLLRKRLEQPDAMLKGWVLDGFPLTLAQAEALDGWLSAVGQPPATVVYLKALTGILINRLTNESPQKEPLPSLQRRLEAHQNELNPLLEYYQPRGQLLTANASLPSAEVSRDLAQLGQTVQGAARMIHDEAEFDAVLAKAPLVVVDCMASWCGSCKQVNPLIDQLADAYGDRANVIKVDFDANQHIPQRFGLKGIPAVMFFKNGELMETLTGVKSYQTYSSVLTRFLD